MALAKRQTGKGQLAVIDEHYNGESMSGLDKVMMASAMNVVQASPNWIGNVDLKLVEIPAAGSGVKKDERQFVVHMQDKTTGETLVDDNGVPQTRYKAFVSIDSRYSDLPVSCGILHAEEVLRLLASEKPPAWVKNINPDHLTAIAKGVSYKLAVCYGGDDADGESDNGIMTHASMNLYKDLYQEVDPSVSERVVEAKAFKSGKTAIVQPPFGRINDKGNGGHIVLTRKVLYGKIPTTAPIDAETMEKNETHRLEVIAELEKDGDDYLAAKIRADPSLHYLKLWFNRRRSLTYLQPANKPVENDDWLDICDSATVYGIVEVQLPHARWPIKVLEEEYTPSLRFDFSSLVVVGVPGHVVTTKYVSKDGSSTGTMDAVFESEQMQDVLQELGMTTDEYTRSIGEKSAKRSKTLALE